jgi:hypothetical protein
MAQIGSDFLNQRRAPGRPAYGAPTKAPAAAPAAEPAARPNYITADDLLHPKNDFLYKSYGFKNSNDNIKAWINRMMKGA